MSRSIKRAVAYMLAVLLCLISPISTLADVDAGGTLGGTTWRPSTGGSSTATIAAYNELGYRVTITKPSAAVANKIVRLSDDPTMEELDASFDAMNQLVTTTYWEPGGYGLNLVTGTAGTGTARFVTDAVVPETDEWRYITMSTSATVDPSLDNPLAWYIWNSDNPNAPYKYKEDIANLFTAEAASTMDPGAWMSQVEAMYNAQPNKVDPETLVRALFGNGKNGQAIAEAFPYFSWSSRDDISSSDSPLLKVLWSQQGLVAMDVIFALTAKKIGDNNTYNKMTNAIHAWVASDYDPDNMAMLMVECTHAYSARGDTSASTGVDFLTLPASLALAYPGTGTVEAFYGEWPEDTWGDTNKAILALSNNHSAAVIGQGALMQAIGGYANNGSWVERHLKAGPRMYCKLLYSYKGCTTAYGYFLNWTYAKGGSPPPPTENKTMGTFTWKLTPNGTHDKTPDTEVNETSTIYDLNISQDGYNKNNYTSQWLPTVRGDGIDCNKIRIRIYHVSENLSEEQSATVYARDAVKQRGALVTTPITKVTVGDGYVKGWPANSGLTSLKVNEWSQNLTDDQFLTIMKTATGLSYTEQVAGKLVNGTTPEGVRVTYAIYVDYDIGCKNPSNPPQLSNDQAEFVEYRSIPGTYTYISDSPEGYAEIKCGYFDRAKGYWEPGDAGRSMVIKPEKDNYLFWQFP